MIQCVACHNEITKDWRISKTQYSKQKFCNLSCKGKWQTKHLRGSRNPNYKHGMSSWRDLLHGSKAYKQWRNAIFTRDNFTCQGCSKKGGYLEADHIKPVATHPDMALDLNNGRTLCLYCHSLTPSFRNSKLNKKL